MEFENNKIRKEYICDTADRINTYILVGDHMLAHAGVSKELIVEAVQKVNFGLDSNWKMITVDLERFIGYSACIPTTDEDMIVQAKRPGRETPSKIVCYKDPIPTTELTLGMSILTSGENMDGLLTVFTAFYGELAPKELSDPLLSDEERPAAEEFWKNHALCSRSIFGTDVPPKEAIVSDNPTAPIVQADTIDEEPSL